MRVENELDSILLGSGAVRRAFITGVVLTLCGSGILLLSATIDQNFWLPDYGLGLFRHAGIPVILLADFLVLILTTVVARRFLLLARKLPVLPQPSNRRYLRRVVARGRASILLKNRALHLFLFSAGIGFMFWLINAIQTLNPIPYYGRDVFDSANHTASYIAVRFILGLSWIIIYPYVFVVIISVSGNIFLATRTLGRQGRLSYKTFHPDRCGGFSFVGDINFFVIMALLVLYTALITVIYVHHKLNVLQVSGFLILSCLFVGTTIFISWPTVKFLMKARRVIWLREYRLTGLRVNNLSILKLIWIVTVASFSPYSTYQRFAINGARIMPIAIAGVRFMVQT